MSEKATRARREAFVDPSVKRGWKSDKGAATHLRWLLQIRSNILSFERVGDGPYIVHPLFRGPFTIQVYRRCPYDLALSKEEARNPKPFEGA